MSELILMENLQRIFTEYERMTKVCLDAGCDQENRYLPPEKKAEIYRQAIIAASKLQAHYGQQVTYCGNLLGVLGEQLDTCEYMNNEADHAAISARLPGHRIQLMLSERCFCVSRDCAEKLISHLEKTQGKNEYE